MYVHVTQNLRLNINVLAAIFGDEFYDLRSNLCSISRLMLPFCANLTKLCGSSHHGLLHDNFAMANATRITMTPPVTIPSSDSSLGSLLTMFSTMHWLHVLWRARMRQDLNHQGNRQSHPAPHRLRAPEQDQDCQGAA